MKHLIAVTAAALLLTSLEARAVDPSEVKAVYSKKCSKCHGLDGKGKTKMGRKLGAKDYTDQKVQDSMDDQKMFAAIKDGLKVKGKRKMKAEKDLADVQVKALIAYMRAFAKK